MEIQIGDSIMGYKNANHPEEFFAHLNVVACVIKRHT